MIDKAAKKYLRDHSWLWCHLAGIHNGDYNLPGDSTIAPAEAGKFLGIERMIYVCLKNEPQPPFHLHAEPLREAKQLVWSIVGDASSTRNNRQTDLEPVLALKQEFPNLVGGMMDDFFQANETGDKLARWSVDAVAAFRQQLQAAGMSLWVVVYDQLLELPIAPWLAHCDVITYWTWQARNLAKLEENFARMEAMAPHQRKLLGIYMWDYGCDAPMPMETMKQQCEVAQRLLAEGRIEGLVFLASNLCDLDIDTVHYVKNLLTEE